MTDEVLVGAHPRSPQTQPRDAAPARVRRRTDALWLTLVAVVTAGEALLPLLASSTFYLRGDTGAQFAPTWFHLGEMVRAGRWPPYLDPGAWAGGNYAAEALFGVFNPLNVPVWVFVSVLPDLLVSVVAVKVAVMVLLAVGTYLLCREYAAQPWSAAVVAAALPVSGFTLFWDAGSWASGLVAFAHVPWVWWAFRRTLRGALNPLWAFLVGALAVTQGNPYGTLAVAVVGAALLVEGAVTGNLRGAVRLALTGLCVAAFLPLVYLPLLEVIHLAYRVAGPPFMNNGKLRPEAGDLLGLSSPTYVPSIRAVTGQSRVPVAYFAWFLVPLLPWLRFGGLRGRGRDLTGVAMIGLVYLVLTLGPSKLWLFRWPLRLVEYLYLAVAVLLAVVLGGGLHRDRWLARLGGSAVLVGLLAWLTWAQDPQWTSAALGGTLMLLVLTCATLAWHRWGPRAGAALAAVLMAGTAGVTLGQVVIFGENASSRPWFFPHDVSTLQDRFSGRDGLVLQLADLKGLQAPRRQARLRQAWQHYLAGSMYQVAGVDSVNAYSGMGYQRFTKRLCMSYDGLARACGFRQVWQPVTPGGPPLVDLMKVDTLVVQPRLAAGVAPPPGWEVARTPGGPLVLTRTRPLPWPDSRLSGVPQGATVDSARTVGSTGERVTLSGTGRGGRVVFGTLAWPGYRATFAGDPVPVSANPAGLLTVAVPPSAAGVLSVGYAPPGLRAGLAAAAVGALGALVLGVVDRRTRRHGGRRSRAGDEQT